jgi:hypothetical protein
MASPKSFKDVSVVAPAAPAEVKEADDADPGEVAEAKAAKLEREAGQWGEQKAKPFKPREDQPGEEKQTSWIEIELVGEDDKPIAGEAYQITMPDGSVKTGTLDEKGFARVEGMDPGTCKVTFPDLDKDAWEKK